MKPKKRHTKSRKRIRRAEIKMTALVLSTCPKCKHLVKPHTVCEFCG
ncbi:50S ribosomal protein L32, partial [Patescibacteria group bacterium]|nr:50S ribosomal protein L32 [Patescibacteria group bacterium]